MKRSHGFTLIELVMFIVVVSAALAGVLSVFDITTRGSADPQLRRQALAIAESLLEEIQLMPLTFCDPDDAKLASAESAVVGAGVEFCATLAESAMASEAGESRFGGLLPFDNVNDYNGFTMTVAGGGIRDITNAQVEGLEKYAASVTVVAADLGPAGQQIGAASGEALRITVRVTDPNGNTVSLEGWRTRYAPRDAL